MGISLFGTQISTFVTPVSANFEGVGTKCLTDSNTKGDGDDGSDSSDGNAFSGGDWTQKGTGSYKNALAVWNYWKKRGFSGTAIAGIMGNAAQESRFDPKAFDGGSGHGIFQFTGAVYTGYTNWSGYDKSESIKNQMDYTWHAMQSAQTAHGVKNNKVLIDALKEAKSVNDATDAWEQQVEAAGIPAMENRHSYAKTAYRVFGGAKVSGNSALLGGLDAAEAGDEAKTKASDPCGSQESSDADGNIVKVAKSLLGYFHYELVHGVSNIGSVEHPDKDGRTDCSGYVWLVLKKAGYKVPDNMGWFTQMMEDDAKGKHQWLKEISKSEAKPGDVVIVNTGNGSGGNGHTAILLSKWKGDNTKIIEEGGRTERDSVNTDTFRYSFSSLLDKGGKPVIARPVKKD